MITKCLRSSVLALSLSLLSMALADAPAIDATSIEQNSASQSVEHHWYDGPITSRGQASSKASVPSTHAIKAEAALELPSVSDEQSTLDASPRLAATDAVILPQPPVQVKALPPVESLTDTHVSEVTPPPPSTVQQTNHEAYAIHSSGWPAKQASFHQPTSTTSSSLNQQVRRLNQQLQNLIGMNLPQQVADMQDQIQQLSGLLEEEQHELAELKEQQKVFYKDLDARISHASRQHDDSASSKVADTSDSGVQTLTDIAEYQRASEFLSDKHYDQARVAYQQYLTDYPKGQFVANAHYWLGELNLLKKNNSAALKEFSTVIKQYPSSAKRPDAEYKIASIQMDMGHVDDAKQGFQTIQKHYPKSTAAQLAAIQLKKIAVTQSG
ncbi:MAG: tol-pal system protein YbgF [Coxiellaceae bacterium]|nr:tol-pal system protein YbgF [Coxiellaceae bacterium]